MTKRIILMMAALVGSTRSDQAADIAAWQKAANEAQAVMAAQKQRELAVKQDLTDALRGKLKPGEENFTVDIFDNDISIRAKPGQKWLWPRMDGYAKKAGY